MGDPTGVDTLAEAVQAREWDKGWKYTGMGQYGPSMSVLDSLIIALGRTRRDEALEPILAKVRQLGPDDALSHHRAVAEALETLGNPAAAKALGRVAAKARHDRPRLHQISTWPRGTSRPVPTDTSTRECSLRELIARPRPVPLRRLRRSRREDPGRVRPGPARPLRPPRPGDPCRRRVDPEVDSARVDPGGHAYHRGHDASTPCMTVRNDSNAFLRRIHYGRRIPVFVRAVEHS